MRRTPRLAAGPARRPKATASAASLNAPAAGREAEGQRDRLDDRPQWVVVSEANQFFWPGPDLRPTPGDPLTRVVIGDLPDGFIRALRAAAAATLGRLLHHSPVLNSRSRLYRLRDLEETLNPRN